MNIKHIYLKTEVIWAMNDILNIINQGKGDCV